MFGRQCESETKGVVLISAPVPSLGMGCLSPPFPLNPVPFLQLWVVNTKISRLWFCNTSPLGLRFIVCKPLSHFPTVDALP